MPDLLKSKTVTARKPHGCQTCNATAIQPGEQYQRDTYVYDGRVYDWTQCTACSALGSMVYEWAYYPDEGVGRDDYTEWAREVCHEDTLTGEHARWYLSRIGEVVTHPTESDDDSIPDDASRLVAKVKAARENASTQPTDPSSGVSDIA